MSTTTWGQTTTPSNLKSAPTGEARSSKGGAEGYKQEDEAGEALVVSIANIIICLFILNKPVRIHHLILVQVRPFPPNKE